ncbi:hypothetical protein [Streptomyces sp. NPDC090080]|uniref:hypothetical protein n=1 Tax=Streptomyces sp. NPDC090080 TaxID=3365939 RepID=UPI003807C193
MTSWTEEADTFAGARSPGLSPGVFRVAPLPGETTASLIRRTADRYGLETTVLRPYWRWRNHPPRHQGPGERADAEVLLNAAGRQVLAQLCGVEEQVLARALPAFGLRDGRLQEGPPSAAWRTAAGVAVRGACAEVCLRRSTGVEV